MYLVYYDYPHILTHELLPIICFFIHVYSKQILITYNNSVGIYHFPTQIMIMTRATIATFILTKLRIIFFHIHSVPYSIRNGYTPVGFFISESGYCLIYYLMFFFLLDKFWSKIFIKPFFTQKMILPFRYKNLNIIIQHIHNFINIMN